MDWAEQAAGIQGAVDCRQTFLCGHSRVRMYNKPHLDFMRNDAFTRALPIWLEHLHLRPQGAKLSVLAAARDRRVQVLCLLDPIDFADAAPLGPGFPSAVQALKTLDRRVPVAVIGSGSGGNCVPKAANY
ncbi:hypothetical protein MMC29_000566, partial [Sticta canariensis]|nr:hypothetical protein [Sticta canariensis]